MNRKHRERPGRGGGPARSERRPAGHDVPARSSGHARKDQRLDRGIGSPPDPWVYGTHAALAAIGNPLRRIRRVLIARDLDSKVIGRVAAAIAKREHPIPEPEQVAREEIDRLLPRGAVHQGLAAMASDLPERDVDDVIRGLDGQPSARLLVLDQITDPHNVGAILRSAAAFGVAAVVLPERHAPAASAVMAKAASGAMERVPIVRVVNLARTLDQLKAANIWCIGLDGDAEQDLAQSDLTGRIALVLGAEGDGLRRLTRERCDALVRIPIAAEAVESLNVSNAAAIALYEIARRG
ncbi:MAG: 23S rRNA (guanosine(2251)-2'-O)-methyltransferase RlmB [Alphaproteobacteria bacterium]|nr:23S rRNA (guanosine(2251)-2'-O)-methyltransferase RlmB [Alphaproteobacteria bacterium]